MRKSGVHGACVRIYGPNIQRASGALDEGSRNVRKASTHSQPDSRTRWCRSALPCPRSRVPRRSANHEHTYDVPAGCWIRAQGGFNKRAHISLVLIHVGVDQRCRAPDVEPPAKLPNMSTCHVPAGRWMRAQARFKRLAHPISPILVHVGVGQRCRAIDCCAIVPSRIDEDATPLQRDK